jgi:hypothetical protein
MQLLEQKIGFPLISFNDVKITLTAPFIPTAIEKVVVKIIGRFANDDVYGTLPLRQIFTDILGVPEPDFILRKTLDELSVKGMINGGHSANDMMRQQVRSFSLTEQGKRLQRENILYGIAQERFEDYSYDPIADKLINEPLGWKPEKPQSAIDETAFTQTFPSTHIQKDLTKNKPDWFTPQTKIGGVESTAEPLVTWKEQSFTFNVEKGELRIKGNNTSEKYADYINSLSADTLFANFLANYFGNLSDWESFPLMEYEEFEKLPKSGWMQINGRFDNFAGNPNVACFNPEWDGYKFGANRLYFDSRLDRPVRINQKGSRHISVQGDYPFDDAICVTEKYALRGVRIPVRFNGEQLELPMIIRQGYDETNQFVADFLAEVVKLADIRIERDDTAAWKNQNKRWQKLIDRFWDNFN